MQFSKMHGLGNDFVIINNINKNFKFSTNIINKLSNRNFGIGFDQLLIIESPHNIHYDFYYRIFNANGTEVFQCGNGIRCVAYFIKLKQLTNKKILKINTQKVSMLVQILNNKLIKVNMGKPNFIPNKIPFIIDKQRNFYKIKISSTQYINCGIVSLGNPHCIIIVNTFNILYMNNIYNILTQNKCFPEKINIGFMKIINNNFIKLRVYERDVGETLACGSGACAAVAVGIKQSLLLKNVCVELLGGTLEIYWEGPGYELYMTGSAEHVYDGIINNDIVSLIN